MSTKATVSAVRFPLPAVRVGRLRVALFLSALALAAVAAAQDLEDVDARENWLRAFVGGPIGRYFEDFTPSPEVLPPEWVPPPEWTPLGPARYIPGRLSDNSINRMGRINAVAFHPTNPRIIYAGAPAGGLWRSKDGGATWGTLPSDPEPIGKRLALLAVSGIAVDWEEPDRIYVLTGDGNGGINNMPSLQSIGVLMSTDGGETWSPSLTWGLDPPYWGFELVIDPCDAKVLFAVSNQGIWKTSDRGASWRQCNAENFRDLELRPRSRGQACEGATQLVYASTTTGIYRSTGGGEPGTWEMVKDLTDDVNPKSSRIEVGVTPANPKVVYAVAGDSDGIEGVYRSDDEGKKDSFLLKAHSPNILGWKTQGSDASSQAKTTLAMAVSPVNADDVHVGCASTWRSLDGGSTWCITSSWQKLSYLNYLHTDSRTLAFTESATEPDSYDLYSGNDGGVAVVRGASGLKPDGVSICGMDWQDLSQGLEITQVFRFCNTTQDPGLIYFGAQDNGSSRIGGPRQCHGQVIQDNQTGCAIANGDGGTCVIDPYDKNLVFVTKQGGRIFRVDGAMGIGVVSVTPPVSSSARSNQQLTPLAIASGVERSTLYACYDDLWKTIDRGATWEKVNQKSLGSESCIAIAVSPDGQILYVTKNAASSLLWSQDAGATWSQVQGLPTSDDFYVTDIAMSARDPRRVWLSAVEKDTFHVFAVESGVARDLNTGPGALVGLRALAIVHHRDPGSPVDQLYVGTQFGVHAGVCEAGATQCTWRPFMIPPLMVMDLEILERPDGGPDRIRAATYGRGIWEFEFPPRRPGPPGPPRPPRPPGPRDGAGAGQDG